MLAVSWRGDRPGLAVGDGAVDDVNAVSGPESGGGAGVGELAGDVLAVLAGPGEEPTGVERSSGGLGRPQLLRQHFPRTTVLLGCCRVSITAKADAPPHTSQVRQHSGSTPHFAERGVMHAIPAG